ncbi:glycosyltransferase family 4 protein [Bacillus cereus]|uniref:Glycosyl transferase n=1 Tax=Bacillus cereus TaxID=1396 RepID=A0A2B1DAJ5_BACCE|nr:glycosyltransferase family 4 protein [Bacillus cereus]PFM36016.1 glycosyl transferase [Bacillus cereus]PGQ08147.1 glycosyl transferase [Bacillus cereus]
MKLFFIGDFDSDNGPASVNKTLRKYMPDNTLYPVQTKRYKRIMELLLKIWQVDAVIFSGLSKAHIVGFKIAKLFGKKSAYLMHGSALLEGEINQNSNKNRVNTEKKVLELAPITICVSEIFMNSIKERYPQFSDKVTYVNNGIDWDMFGVSESNNVTRDKNMVLCVGGGTPLKKIQVVCKAIDYLNNYEGYNLELTVIGSFGKDTNEIKSYPFVTYIERVAKNDMDYYYKTAQLYIQNSEFETFGLATVEALISGCNLLISKNVGAKAIINGLETNDVINDVNDIKEISKKIICNLVNDNNDRLINSIKKDQTSVEESYKKILDILKAE